MEKLKNNIDIKKYNFGKIKSIVVALGLALGVSNFSYSQENNLNKMDNIEQTNEKDRGNIEKYKINVEKRNYNIVQYTSETLDEFTNRLKNQFFYEMKSENNLISEQIEDIKYILENKFGKKNHLNDPIKIIQLALKEISTMEKYAGLNIYTDKFSGEFDMNFINAYGFVQIANNINCNWDLTGKSGVLILQNILDDLNRNFDYSKNNMDNKVDKKMTIEKTDEIIVNKEDKSVPNVQNKEKTLDEMTALTNNLSLDRLNGVNYQEVLDMVEGIRDEGLKHAVMDCLVKNDVIGAQKLLGMDINCDKNKYPNYVASKKLGKRELNLMKKYGQTRKYMDAGEILELMERIENAYEIENYEVKNIYMKFLSGEFDNGGLPYCILSKYDYCVYLFSADHKLLFISPVLTGATVGNDPNDANNPDPKKKIFTTPGGMYKLTGFYDTSDSGSNLFASFSTDYGVLYPLEGQYNITHDQNGIIDYTLGIHGEGSLMGTIVDENGNKKKVSRKELYTKNSTKAKRQTNGCINIIASDSFPHFENELKSGSLFYICFDDEVDVEY